MFCKVTFYISVSFVKWGFHWKVSFKSDSTKQADVTFTIKTHKEIIPRQLSVAIVCQMKRSKSAVVLS